MHWWTWLVKGTFRDSLGNSYDDNKVKKVASDLYRYYHSPKSYVILDDGIEAMRKVKQQKLEVGLITNSDNRIHDVISLIGLRKFVDFVITSEDAQSSKPERKIFELALEKRRRGDRIDPGQVLHVGDNYDLDYVGSRKMGWNCVLVDRHGDGSFMGANSNHVVENLNEIFNKSEF